MLPQLGAHCEQDCKNFQEMGDLKKKIFSCIGWAVSLRKVMLENGIKKINDTYLPMIFNKLSGVQPRMVTGYSILLFFVDEVSETIFLKPGNFSET